MKSDTPKQYMKLRGRPVISYSLDVFQKSQVEDIILVSAGEDVEYCQKDSFSFCFNHFSGIILPVPNLLA